MKINKINILFLLVIFPIVVLCFLIWKYGYRFPYWDEILYLSLFDKLNQGTLKFWELFAQQNDHRPFLPRIITLFLAKITSWNELSILYFNVFLVILSFLILFYIIILPQKQGIHYNGEDNRKPGDFSRLLQVFSASLISLLMFSWVQMENWVWGLQLMMFLTNFLYICLLSILTIYKLNLLTLCISIIIAIFASFSFANGLLIWVTALPLLIYKYFNQEKKNPFLILIWILSGVGVLAFYFSNYHRPGITSIEKQVSVLERCLYFILYIGSPISGLFFIPPWHGINMVKVNIGSYLFGIAGLLLWMFLFFKIRKTIIIRKRFCIFENNIQKLMTKQELKQNIEEYFFWKSLALFSILSGVLLAFGRSGLGLGQALSSRYITTNMLFWCSILGMFNFYLKQQENRLLLDVKNYLKIFTIIIFVVVYVVLTLFPVYTNKRWHNIARWKNLGWYALSSGYNGKLYYTDLWGTENDFIDPKTLRAEFLPLFRKYNLCGVYHFDKPNIRQQLAPIYIQEARYFIYQKLWKPAVCYIDTAEYLNPSLPEIQQLKKEIPPEIFPLYKKYQEEGN
ncbi:MAG TPA: hypothetical protein PLT82_08520 [Candidatus Hydrogenedens sp.]|nr:hypothetical protein [Candidatus Hydrogenedens sp.]HPP59160.1 hypothetical protein [Candidatus Hydrogenedens sp.]